MQQLPAPVENLTFRVADLRRVTPVIVELVLDPLGQHLVFRAGQYVVLSDEAASIPPRSYSIANAPQPQGSLRLLVTREPGGRTSGWVHERLHSGDRVSVSGPYGTFVTDSQQRQPILCCAGGSGIAPARALAEEAASCGFPQPFTLAFSARTHADLIDADTFHGWTVRFPRFRFVRTLTREPGDPPLGRLPDLMPSLFGRLEGWDVFISGAPAFVSAVTPQARRLGVEPGHLHTEEFFVEPEPWTAVTKDAS